MVCKTFWTHFMFTFKRNFTPHNIGTNHAYDWPRNCWYNFSSRHSFEKLFPHFELDIINGASNCKTIFASIFYLYNIFLKFIDNKIQYSIFRTFYFYFFQNLQNCFSHSPPPSSCFFESTFLLLFETFSIYHNKIKNNSKDNCYHIS